MRYLSYTLFKCVIGPYLSSVILQSMTEKFSDKNIIGGTPEQKEGAVDELNQRLDTQSWAFEKWKDAEVPKTPEVRHFIEIVNKAVKEVLHTYGVEVDVIPTDTVHVIKGETWPERLGDAGAFFSLVDQCVVIPDNRRPIQTAMFLAHEFFHFHSHQAAQFMKDGLATNYRVGVSVTSRDGQTTFFEELNEAITETLARECFYTEDFQTNFAEEIKETKRTITEHPNALDDGNGKPLFNDQTYYATIGGPSGEGSVRIFTEQFVYQNEREAFELLCEKLYERNTDQYNSPNELKKIFVQAAFTGKLLEIGKIVEKTFGNGVFRKLAEAESGQHFLDFVRSLA